MSETVNTTPKFKYDGHPHHLFKIPVVDVTTQESTDEEEWQMTTTAVEPSAGNSLTAVTRSIVNKCTPIYRKLYGWLAYNMLLLTQSPHIIMASAIVLIIKSLIPDNVSEMSIANYNDEKVKPRIAIHFVYQASFSLHLGSQFWMTLVSGLSLYLNLSRHAFGDVQKILFPKYFLINSFLSVITLIQFRKMAVNISELYIYSQLIALNLSFLLELAIWLYVVPEVLQLIDSKTAIEKAAGLGNEVGRCNLGRLVDCPHYMEQHQGFRKKHIYMVIGNVVSIICSIYHLVYIAI